MDEPEHKCENCLRGRIGVEGVRVCIVGKTDSGWDIVYDCPDSRTCPEWSERDD
jgi:hypothetical protein